MWTKQKEIQKYADDRGWIERNPANPANLAKSIVIESAELLEHFQWSHPTKEAILKDKKLLKEIRLELADVAIYCFDMAIALDLDLEEVISEKLKIVEKKYPVKKVLNNKAAYFKIKKKFRKKHA